jgi:WD40 repeat protein
VFVSYARADLGFVRDLVAALRDAGRRVWVDLEGLYAGEQWWSRICAEIEAADTILLVLSPSSAESTACRAEIEHAARLRKRIIPVLHEHPGGGNLPEVVSSTQWLLAFQQGGSFTGGMEALQKALDADPEWLRGHTRWLQRALDWDRRGRPRDLLLSGDHLVEAERWLDDAPRHRDPAVSAVHYSYIRAARQQQLFSRAREYLAARGQEVEALETAVAACELATDVPKPHPADFSTLSRCVKRVRRAFPFRGHGGPVWNIEVGATGERAVTNGTNGRAQLWDLTDFPPRLVARLEGAGRSREQAAVFSPQGSRLLTRNFETATLWDSLTGEQVAELKADSPPKSLKFSPDGGKVIGAAADKSWIWNSDTGALETTLECPACREAFITADGSKVLARGYPAVRIWNLITGELCCELKTGKRWAFSAARFSPDGTRVVTANETRRVRVWSASKGESLGLLDGGWEIEDAGFSPDGKMIFARGNANSLQLWRVDDGVALPDPWGTHSVALFALSPEGKHLLTTNGDAAGKVQVWEIASGRAVGVSGHGATVTTIEWSDNGRLVMTAGEDGVIRVWDVATWSTRGLMDARAGTVHAAVFVPRGGGILAGYDDGAARLWRFDDSLALAMTKGEVFRLVMAPRGGTAVVLPKENEPPWLCATTTLQRLGTLQTGPHCRACFSPDGKWIAVLGGGVLHMIQADSLETVFRWPAMAKCEKLCFSSGGDRLVALGGHPQYGRCLPAVPR